jgi:hypothetical protein
MIEFEWFLFFNLSKYIKFYSLKGTNSRPKMKNAKWVSPTYKMLKYRCKNLFLPLFNCPNFRKFIVLRETHFSHKIYQNGTFNVHFLSTEKE